MTARPAQPTDFERLAGLGLAVGRLAIGAGLWLAPGPSSRALGFERLDGPALALARIAATRDLVLGAWQLSALGDRGRLARATLGVALGDERTRVAGLRGLPAAAAAAGAGLWLARRLRHSADI